MLELLMENVCILYNKDKKIILKILWEKKVICIRYTNKIEEKS